MTLYICTDILWLTACWKEREVGNGSEASCFFWYFPWLHIFWRTFVRIPWSHLITVTCVLVSLSDLLEPTELLLCEINRPILDSSRRRRWSLKGEKSTDSTMPKGANPHLRMPIRGAMVPRMQHHRSPYVDQTNPVHKGQKKEILIKFLDNVPYSTVCALMCRVTVNWSSVAQNSPWYSEKIEDTAGLRLLKKTWNCDPFILDY